MLEKEYALGVVDKAESGALRLYIVETICVLEVSVPFAFFDIMQAQPHASR